MNDEPFNVHDFCEAMRHAGERLGGDAYRSWVSCLYHKGILIGFHNHEWFVRISSNPNATAKAASCRDSRCSGDPWPSLSDGAKWVSIGEFTSDSAKKNILSRIEEAKNRASYLIQQCLADKLQKEREAKDKQDRQQATLDDAWIAAN